MKKVVLVSLLLALILSAGRVQAISGFQNSGFEDGTLGFWNPTGNVSILFKDDIIASGEIYTLPYEGQYMALISSPAEHGGGYVYENYLSQGIDSSVGTISFWYNVFTRDYDNDKPGFAVSINGSNVFSIDAYADADGDGVPDVDFRSIDPPDDSIWTTDWCRFEYDLSGLSGTATLSIFAGNTDNFGTNGDNSFNSWAYIDFAEPAFTAGPGPAPVPEPNTLTLLLSAMMFLGLLLLGQRRKI